ncbi:hypothetical protein A2U01_0069321, partial [Trifolium medium]|nr:hypothetical protein [Trifolium medium]
SLNRHIALCSASCRQARILKSSGDVLESRQARCRQAILGDNDHVKLVCLMALSASKGL